MTHPAPLQKAAPMDPWLLKMIKMQYFIFGMMAGGAAAFVGYLLGR